MIDLFCFGYGYCARHLVAQDRAAGDDAMFARVTGTTRDPGKAAALEREGIVARIFDGAGGDPPIPDDLGASDALLTSIAPDQDGDPVLRHYERAITDAPRLSWIGYLSTIGVYGDTGGEWIDEETEFEAVSARAKARRAAEEAWLALGERTGKAVQIFRLGGIYGPGRSAITQLRAGKARRIVKPGQVFNRIHVADIAAVLRASLAKPDPGRIYNLVDDHPAPPQDVIAHAAELIGMEPPPEIPFAEAEMSPMARAFYADCKRVRSRRIREELGVTLQYPDYRAGLAALAAQEE
ncbi:MAG: nucleoside-diphosphate-sugar epimerase [Saliniramus fredricksonii]|uniref:Nucleoside-diphosphate-sugar epimerase n=1 Tax=Saliniramus fredricksonii TaxID=1653334 RepID=A0A0P8BHV1_9HYPH|nr:MAG: nucleoside-diphosphate-sugar epimerase [Saliniramus fredricksonii]SCC78616.1 Nucleoside-diphosphate-sugar epimerase [Saliniramus fredricksonii]